MKNIWKNKFYVQVYQWARTGLTDTQIAQALKIRNIQFKKWVEVKSGLKFALAEGRKKDETIQEEYIYGKLSSESKLVWDQIRQSKGKYTDKAIDRLIDQHGDGVRKMLFLYCLVRTCFNTSKACRQTGVSYTKYKEWIETDYSFANAIEEVQWHKGHLYENAFIDLVKKEKDPAAIIFANKTFNRNRGYGEKVEVNHTGNISNSHVIELGPELLDRLSKSARTEIMQVMDQLQLEQQEPVTVNAL